MEKRRIFIGDIQGCREELERLLEKLRFDPSSDEVHPVGDFVNRGPDSAGTLRVCRMIGAGGVLGNHDVHLLRVVKAGRNQGKRDTIQDILRADDRDELCAWLEQRPIVRALDGMILVHAGVSPAWKDPVAALTGLDPLAESDDLDFAIAARYCDPTGRMASRDWPPPGDPFRPWHEFWSEREDEKRTVVYGHWARAGLMVRERVLGLDTGCVWGGALTAWIADEERMVQVEAKRTYSAHD
jgi:bis(5'-nucleosyl)-tetraphosphatase (symmetrical)